MNRIIKEHFEAHLVTVAAAAKAMEQDIADLARKAVSVLEAGNKLLVMGNGGSAADAQHLAAELVGRFLQNRRALPAVALTTDTSILTAVGNDFGFDEVFSRQVEALAVPGDLVLGISTSGNSPNVLKAMQLATERGCVTAALLGRDGGAIAAEVELPLVVRDAATPFVQETHLTIIHILCRLVEETIFGARESK